MRTLLLVSLLALAIPSLCFDDAPVVQHRSVNGGMMYLKLYRVNLDQAYSLVANASLDGSSWALAKPGWQVTIHKETVSSSPLQGNALNIIVDPSCSSNLHSEINFGATLTNNESLGTFTDFYTNSYTYPCPIGSWVYDPQNVVSSIYFYITVDTPQVPICPFTLKYGTGPSPNANCPSSTPQYPGGPAPNTGGSGGGLSTGAIVGIAIGGVCAIVLVFALVVLARRRSASTSEYTQPLTQQPHDTGYQTGETEHYPRHDTTGHTFA